MIVFPWGCSKYFLHSRISWQINEQRDKLYYHFATTMKGTFRLLYQLYKTTHYRLKETALEHGEVDTSLLSTSLRALPCFANSLFSKGTWSASINIASSSRFNPLFSTINLPSTSYRHFSNHSFLLKPLLGECFKLLSIAISPTFGWTSLHSKALLQRAP